MAEKRYIRLITEGMDWTGKVAEFIKVQHMGPGPTRMYQFKDIGSSMKHNRVVAADEAEFITKKEYFIAVLQGKEFDG